MNDHLSCLQYPTSFSDYDRMVLINSIVQERIDLSAIGIEPEDMLMQPMKPMPETKPVQQFLLSSSKPKTFRIKKSLLHNSVKHTENISDADWGLKNEENGEQSKTGNFAVVWGDFAVVYDFLFSFQIKKMTHFMCESLYLMHRKYT